MISYLTVMFQSEGAKPSDVVDRLYNLGFKPMTGNYDFYFEWDKKASIKDTIWFADKIHATLKGMNVIFKLESK